MPKPSLAVIVAAAVAAGCTTESTSSTTSTGFTISGVARAAPATAYDGDVADPAAPFAPNDDAAHAQALPSVVTVGGCAGPADPTDFYRVRLAAGQVVTLDVANATSVDLDLAAYYATSGAVAVTSQGTGAVEQVAVPASEDYFILVAATGALSSADTSNYVLTLSRGAATASAGALDPHAEFVPGEVIVRFRDDLPFAAGVETLAARAASVGLAARAGGPRREMLLELPAGAAARAAALAANGIAGRATGPAGEPIVDDLEADRVDTVRLVKALRRRADVASADLNYVRHALAVPNDPGYAYQWHYPLMNLPQAWDVTTGTPATGEVIVAVVDTGVLLSHPDLVPKLVPGFDFIRNVTTARDGDGLDASANDPGTSASPGQSSWHGTHVAGTIGAASDNGAGVAGVSWGARIMPLRALGLNGAGESYSIIQSVRFAAGLANDSGGAPARKADVINLSLGSPSSSVTEEQLFQAVRAAGVIVVAAAGNDGTSDLFYPASYPGVVSVSAVDAHRQRAPYSNFGTQVDVAAPGGDMSAILGSYPAGILSTLGDDAGTSFKMTYGFLQGTSMASPHVAGVVALMRAVCPALAPDQLDAALASGAVTTDLGDPGRDDVFGWGLVDAFKAVRWASDPRNCASTTGTVTTVIQATPARLDFVPSGATSAIVTIGTLPASDASAVTSVAVGGAPAWLTVTPVSVSAGLGTYRLAPRATGLADGVYSGSVTFTASPLARSVVVPVTLQVGASSASSNAGFVYLLLVDATTGETVGQVERSPSAGAYPFSFTGVPAGTYYVVAGTDSDNDLRICDAGESCGAYPSISEPAVIDASKNPSNLTFQVGFDAALHLGAASAPQPGAGLPPAGLARRPARRAVEVTP